MTEKELDAIIRLLDDPDTNVYNAVEKKICDEGEHVIPALEKVFLERDDNKIIQKRLGILLPKLENNATLKYIKNWRWEANNSLVEFAYLISKVKYFELSRDRFNEELDELRIHIPRYSLENYSPLERVKVMNYVFFRKMGFKPLPNNNYYGVNYGYPQYTLESKMGSPEILALFYAIFAREAGMPIHGVNLPKNFILAYADDTTKSRFYVNPLTNGSIFEKKEIDNFLSEMAQKPAVQFYAPCKDDIFALRILKRLHFTYIHSNEADRAKHIERLMGTFQSQLSANISWV